MLSVRKVIPVLRMFDVAKAEEFYMGWLDFNIDWQHRFSDDAPLYMQISLGDITLHLSEHHGDASPGGKVFVECTNIRKFHEAIIAKEYKYNRPALENAPWGGLICEVVDPFLNKIIFNESGAD